MESDVWVVRDRKCARVEAIDTRLVATVQARAGRRIHEAAGLLQAYYLWAHVTGHATQNSSPSLAVAIREVSNAKRCLREFLSPAIPAL